jgi:hypothetical protein
MQFVNLISPKTGRVPRPVRVLWVLGGVLLLLNSSTRAQSPTAGEYQVKAAFLYNFAKFVEWPQSSFSDASAPLRICIFGQDPFGKELRDITREKTVNGRKLEVSHVIDLRHARSCQILFIASSGGPSAEQLVAGLRGASVLTVADTRGFTEQGGMINFVVESDRVQFEVNHKAAEEAGLKISSRLLSVAKIVIVQALQE